MLFFFLRERPNNERPSSTEEISGPFHADLVAPLFVRFQSIRDTTVVVHSHSCCVFRTDFLCMSDAFTFLPPLFLSDRTPLLALPRVDVETTSSIVVPLR